MNTTEGIIIILVAIGLLIVVFLICREIICWYYKINLRVSLQTESTKYLKVFQKNSTPEEPVNIVG